MFCLRKCQATLFVATMWVVCIGALNAQDIPLGNQVKTILEKSCYECHGKNGADQGGFGSILDFEVVKDVLVSPSDLESSSLFQRVAVVKDMPPDYADEEIHRPTADEINIIKAWIESGAVPPEAEEIAPRPEITLKEEVTAINRFLFNARRDERPYLRFFTMRHLHNMPNSGPAPVRDQDLRLYRAALSKLLNSLSYVADIVVPQSVDEHETLFVVDLRDFNWTPRVWNEILSIYPYGLSHGSYPEDKTLNDMADQSESLIGEDVIPVRVDWFISTASRPPLYHDLLNIPTDALTLERNLNVDVAGNILKGQAYRGGFNGSGVSGSNRMVERHKSKFGFYWKSYDFKTSAGLGNLFIFPLGPRFDSNPFNNNFAFEHDGGEIIFSLPNGLQAYMLVDGKDQRIDSGPIEVVNDDKQTSGTPLVVNGLSCMSCHAYGMKPFKDQIRDGHILEGSTKDFVERLYIPVDEMNTLVERDANRFLNALDEATGPFLRVGEDADKQSISDFTEPITPIAKWYLVQEIDLEMAARELGCQPQQLQQAIEYNDRLQRLGLYPLTQGSKIKREVWENRDFLVSPYQEAAKALKLGTIEIVTP